MPKHIVMIGSSLEVRGGISAMVRVYRDHGLFRRWRSSYLATHKDGSRPRKAVVAAIGWWSYMARLATARVALLHAHMASDASFWRKALFIVPTRWLGVPYIIHNHGGDFLEFYRDRCGPRTQKLIRWLYRGARAAIALSEQGRADIEAIVPGQQVVVIPNPVAIPDEPAPLDGTPPTVLYLGVIKPAKGIEDLLRAWPSVLVAVPDARLVLGGTGDIASARALARSLDIEDTLETPGWIVGEAKEALLQRAWVLALPSHWEALPMAVLEALAAGVPVVATRVGGIPTAVEHGRSGLLIDVKDISGLSCALIALLSDRARRRAMGEAGRAHAREAFGADTSVPRIEALWREIVPELEVEAAPPEPPLSFSGPFIP